MENITAVVDNKVLQEKANEYAQKGAEQVIKDFYTGYSSPYKKAIEENLKNRGFDSNFELPDVVKTINEGITKEIDKIANTAIANSFIPLVTKFLTRAEKEMDFSEVLKEFIECTGFKYDDDTYWEDYSVEIKKDEDKFKRIIISDGNNDYEIGLSNFDNYLEEEKRPEKKRWTIYSLPYRYSDSSRTMTLSIKEGAKLEIPFTKGVLENKFVSFIARLVMAETGIYFDTDCFDEDMFPKNHCHC